MRRALTSSLVQAFTAQGVTLADPRSWSGIRDDDGGVVIAIRRADIRTGWDGFSCLLWSPIAERRPGCGEEPRMEERLAHCRLALRAGIAAGLLVEGSAGDAPHGSIVSMLVEKRRNGYWAKWGFAARHGARPAAMRWAGERMLAMAA